MKKVLGLTVALMVLGFSTSVMAFGDIIYNDDSTTAIAAPVIPIVVAPIQTTVVGQSTVVGVITKSEADANAKAVSGSNLDFDMTSIYQREYFSAVENHPFEVGTYQGGKIDFDAMKNYPPVRGVKMMEQCEEVVEILENETGIPIWRNRAEDVLPLLVKYSKKFKEDKRAIRYLLLAKDASFNAGAGGGGSVAGASSTDPLSGSLSVLPGVHTNTFDPPQFLQIVVVERTLGCTPRK